MRGRLGGRGSYGFSPICTDRILQQSVSARAGRSPSVRQNGVSEYMLPARILIVDDNSAARTTIRGLLDWHSFQVCGEAQNGKDAIEKIVELKPDIVLLDINMPVMSGVSAAYEIRRISPATKIVFLTIHDTPGARRNTQLWSHGFVSKSDAGTELIPLLNRLSGKNARATAKSAKSRRVSIVKQPKNQ